MKNQLKRIFSLFVVMVLIFSLTACGKSEGKTETTEDSGQGEKEVTLKITWWGGQARHDYTQKLLDKYTELNPNIKFDALPSGWDGYFDKLSTQAAASSMPDIVQMDYLYISTYAKNNSVADLQPFVDDGTIDVANIDPVLYKSGETNGKLAGMVLSSSLLTFAYNPEVLAQAGLEAPDPDWTWKDFVTMCKTVKEKTGKYGFESIMADDTNIYNYFVRQHGKPLFSEDNKSLGYDDDQIFVDFVDIMTGLIDAGAMPDPDAYNTIKARGVESGAVVTGDAAMLINWSNYGVLTEKNNNKIQLVNPPYGEDGTKALWVKPGMFFSVSENSQVKEEASKFINWFINSEEANDIISAERGTPVSSVIRDYMKNSGKLSEKQTEMFDYVDSSIERSGSTPAPDPIGISEVNNSFYTAVYSVLYGQSAAAAAAAAFRTEANEILARNN